MADTVGIAVRLRAFTRRDGELWVSGCPSLDVYSQGETEDAAQEALREAVQLWIESCLERDTLGQAMIEVGWRAVPPGEPLSRAEEYIAVADLEPAEDVLGSPFTVEVTIPAYQASAILDRGPSGRASR